MSKFPFTHDDLTRQVAVIDYETFYSDDYSVSSLSYWHYTHHPKFRAYRVSIVTNDGFEWVGDPKDAPWELVRGHIWVSHNRPFDWSVHKRLQELSLVPTWDPAFWGNSANLCAWVRAPRSLSKAVKALFGIVHAKAIRDRDMKGRQWEEYGADLQKRVDEYAIEDSRLALRIWMTYVRSWPLHEIRMAQLIDDRGLRGMFVNKEAMEADMDLMRRIIFAATSKIPWANDPDEKVLSPGACARECRKHGIEPPPSFDMKDPGLHAWEDKYGDKFPFVGAMRDVRRMNSMLKKYETIYGRIKADGRFEFSVAYLGTHTGRTSGTDKAEAGRQSANMLNMPRDPFYVRPDLSVVYRKDDLKAIQAHRKANKGALPDGVAHMIDLRSKIVAPPGYKFVICDKSQIEARITNWFADDKPTLDLIRRGFSVYEVHAMRMMGWKPKLNPDGTRVLNKKGQPLGLKDEDPMMYALAKARELALGFQAGHPKFIVMAPTYVSDEEFDAIFNKPYTREEEVAYTEYLEVTEQTELLGQFLRGDDYLKRIRIQSWKQVEQFRASKKHTLVALWKKLDADVKAAARIGGGGKYELELPSGRILQYFNVRMQDGSVVAEVELGGTTKYFYGGKLLENAVQATARDVFVVDQLTLDDMGIWVVLDVYDEVVCEVPLNFDEKVIESTMSISPPWASDLPVGAEAESSTYYKK